MLMEDDTTPSGRRLQTDEQQGVEYADMETGSDPGFTFHISDKWAHCYPGAEVAVVTSVEKPPIPPPGYAPLRLGVHHQSDAFESAHVDTEEVAGFSLDTLLWNEELLEARIDELTAWTRHAPLSLREKLDRINWLVNNK